MWTPTSPGVPPEDRAETDEGEYRCEACGKTFETEAGLEEHVDSVGLCY